jgi:hypothetical protein
MRKPTTNDQTEAWVKQQVKKILERTGWKFWMPNAGVFGRTGVSDFLAIKQPKLFMAIETKYDDVVTALQFEFLSDVHEAGHHAFLVDETNISRLHELLTNLESEECLAWAISSPAKAVSVGPFMKWQDQNPIMDIRIRKTLTTDT